MELSKMKVGETVVLDSDFWQETNLSENRIGYWHKEGHKEWLLEENAKHQWSLEEQTSGISTIFIAETSKEAQEHARSYIELK